MILLVSQIIWSCTFLTQISALFALATSPSLCNTPRHTAVPSRDDSAFASSF
jgi:hypothetical protein